MFQSLERFQGLIAVKKISGGQYLPIPATSQYFYFGLIVTAGGVGKGFVYRRNFRAKGR